MKAKLALFSVLCIAVAVPLSYGQAGRKHLVAPRSNAIPKKTTMPGPHRDACYRLSLEVPEARVFTVNIAPEAATEVNRHRDDYMVVSLGENHMRVAGDLSAFDFDLADSDVQIVKGGWPHRVVNKGGTRLQFVEIDVPSGIAPEQAICGLGRRSCSDGRFGKTPAGHYTYSTLFETAAVKLRKVEMEAGVTLEDFSTGRESLVLALSEIKIGSAAFGQSAEPIRLERGNAAWVSGASLRAACNTGQNTALFLVMEIKSKGTGPH
jgi:mannose-6-phosphate isomerase-like protein (cupin superfamily)